MIIDVSDISTIPMEIEQKILSLHKYWGIKE